MTKVRLLKLELTNYRNIEHEVYVFDGANAKIVGENRIGKTNTLEAIYFLLSNYLLDGSSDISVLKPLSDTKKEVRVEGTFEVEDEKATRTIVLSKTYGEKWVKKRGTDETVMDGHYEEYFVNGIKQSREKDYSELLNEYFGVKNDEKSDIDPIQMLSNPLYLGNIGESKDWTKLRTFIVKLIGDVKDSEIFAKEPSTKVIEKDLTNALGKTDQLKKMYANNLDTLNNQITGFDGQVELLEKTSKPTDNDVANAKAKVEEINASINDIKTNSNKDSVLEQLEKEVFEVSKQVVEMNSKEFNAYQEKAKSGDEAVNNDKIKVINTTINDLITKSTDIQVKKGQVESNIRTKSREKENLADEYRNIVGKMDDVDKEVLTECPTCHRPFNEKDIASSKETILKSYEEKKADIVVRGTALKKEIEELNVELKKLTDDEVTTKNALDVARKDLNELNSKTFERPVFQESAELIKLREKEKALQTQITERKAKVSEGATNNYEKIAELETERETAQKVIEDRNYYDRQMTLLENVKKERKEVSNEVIKTEQKREALKTYIYTKLRLLDEHIAKVFGKLRFQLTKENINGGFDPVCKPYIYDVDKDCSTNVLWRSGSKSEKILTGITIVEAIRKELNLTELPFLFDEGGEISNETLRNKFKTNAQIICVRVEDNINKPIIVKF